MGQEHKQYTWSLIAKKLNGEATPEELIELEQLLRSNPELHYPVQTVTDLWKSATIHDQHLAELAFNRHLDRMKDLNVEFLHPDDLDSRDQHTQVLSNEMMASILASGYAPGLEGSLGGIDADDENDSGSGAGRRKWLGVFRSSWFQTAAAAAVVGVAAAAWFLIKSRSGVGGAGGSQQEVFTAVGSRTHMTLPDGTKVWLNAGSRIHYEKSFGEQGREISLVGEAFFDVASNPKKPFLIHTAKLDIRVLGTSFNVKSYPSDKTTEATLVRGMIEVSILDRPADKIVLKPNEKLIVTNKDSLPEDTQKFGDEHEPNGVTGQNGAHNRHQEEESESMVVIGKPTYDHRSGAMIETSWVDNRLIFQDQNFGELARMMERWYGVTIRFGNEDLKELHFTGILEKESVKQALDALKITAAFGYKIEGKTITIQD